MNKGNDKNLNVVNFVQGDNYKIPDDEQVKVIKGDNDGKILIKHTRNKSHNLQAYKKISRNRYINRFTGEVVEGRENYYKTPSNICDNMKRLKQYLQLYFWNKNVIFITLTYKYVITSLKEVKNDIAKFTRKLKYKSKYELMFVYKVEQTGTMRWHVHFLVRRKDNKQIYIPKDELDEMWQHGFTFIEKVRKNKIKFEKNVLFDLQNNKNSEDTDSTDSEETVSIIDYFCKTNQFYEEIESNARLYGKSKNVKAPEITKRIYSSVKDEIDGNYDLLSEKTLLLEDAETGAIINKHKQETYIKKQKKR